MTSEHQVLRLWVRAQSRAPMDERESIALDTGEGVVDDHTYGSPRHVTIVFVDDWAQAEKELGRSVDPAGRRANVLVSGGEGRHHVGNTLQLGEARIEIMGIVDPCFVMEDAAVGLKDALEPDGRAGIWGRILEGGTVRVGDSLETSAQSQEA